MNPMTPLERPRPGAGSYEGGEWGVWLPKSKTPNRMKKSKLQKAREAYTDANAYIRDERNRRFARQHLALEEELVAGREDPATLRRVAERLIAQGVYSAKGSKVSVERMLMFRLYRANGGDATWPQYARRVAPAWYAKRAG